MTEENNCPKNCPNGEGNEEDDKMCVAGRIILRFSANKPYGQIIDEDDPEYLSKIQRFKNLNVDQSPCCCTCQECGQVMNDSYDKESTNMASKRRGKPDSSSSDSDDITSCCVCEPAAEKETPLSIIGKLYKTVKSYQESGKQSSPTSCPPEPCTLKSCLASQGTTRSCTCEDNSPDEETDMSCCMCDCPEESTSTSILGKLYKTVKSYQESMKSKPPPTLYPPKPPTPKSVSIAPPSSQDGLPTCKITIITCPKKEKCLPCQKKQPVCPKVFCPSSPKVPCPPCPKVLCPPCPKVLCQPCPKVPCPPCPKVPCPPCPKVPCPPCCVPCPPCCENSTATYNQQPPVGSNQPQTFEEGLLDPTTNRSPTTNSPTPMSALSSVGGVQPSAEISLTSAYDPDIQSDSTGSIEAVPNMADTATESPVGPLFDKSLQTENKSAMSRSNQIDGALLKEADLQTDEPLRDPALERAKKGKASKTAKIRSERNVVEESSRGNCCCYTDAVYDTETKWCQCSDTVYCPEDMDPYCIPCTDEKSCQCVKLKPVKRKKAKTKCCCYPPLYTDSPYLAKLKNDPIPEKDPESNCECDQIANSLEPCIDDVQMSFLENDIPTYESNPRKTETSVNYSYIFKPKKFINLNSTNSGYQIPYNPEAQKGNYSADYYNKISPGVKKKNEKRKQCQSLKDSSDIDVVCILEPCENFNNKSKKQRKVKLTTNCKCYHCSKSANRRK